MQTFKKLFVFTVIVAFGCKKETTNLPTDKNVSLSSQSNQMVSAIVNPPINYFTGVYHRFGTRTLYLGSVSGGIVSAVYDFSQTNYYDYEILSASGDKSLSGAGYADYASVGWQYIITLSNNFKTVTVQPNDVMSAGILSGSFITDVASYDATNHTFHFITEYTNVSGNGRKTDETIYMYAY